jgi:hypothetical protein
MAASDRATRVRNAYAAFAAGEREVMEALLADEKGLVRLGDRIG